VNELEHADPFTPCLPQFLRQRPARFFHGRQSCFEVYNFDGCHLRFGVMLPVLTGYGKPEM
jgi:hypothetical protein